MILISKTACCFRGENSTSLDINNYPLCLDMTEVLYIIAKKYFPLRVPTVFFGWRVCWLFVFCCFLFILFFKLVLTKIIHTNCFRTRTQYIMKTKVWSLDAGVFYSRVNLLFKSISGTKLIWWSLSLGGR